MLIDLADDGVGNLGMTPNDLGDGDAGPNKLLNKPMLRADLTALAGNQ